MRFIAAVAGALLLAPLYVQAASFDHAWVDEKRSDATSLSVRDINTTSGYMRGQFVWNPGRKSFDMLTYSQEPANPPLKPIQAWIESRTHSNYAGTVSRETHFHVRGHQTRNPSVQLPSGTIQPLAFDKMHGMQRVFLAKSAGHINPGLYAFSALENGVAATQTVNYPGVDFPPFAGVTITRSGTGLSVNFTPFSPALGTLEYRLKVFDWDLNRSKVFDRVYTSAPILTPEILLAPGERYQVVLSAVTPTAQMEVQGWMGETIYNSAITKW